MTDLSGHDAYGPLTTYCTCLRVIRHVLYVYRPVLGMQRQQVSLSPDWSPSYNLEPSELWSAERKTASTEGEHPGLSSILCRYRPSTAFGAFGRDDGPSRDAVNGGHVVPHPDALHPIRPWWRSWTGAIWLKEGG